MRFFMHLLAFVLKDRAKFEQVQESDQVQPSHYFGIHSLLYGILGCAASLGLAVFGIYAMEQIGGSGSLLLGIAFVIGGVALILGGLLGFGLFLFRGILNAVYQLRLTKKTLGIVALLLNLLVLAASIFFLIKFYV
jgi:hypothetical protein